MTLSLKCYICHTNDNNLCIDDKYLVDCPSNQAYDRCMTRVFKNPPDGFHIKKECALAPCHLRDPKLDFIKFKDQCRNNDDDCIHCCETDGCNKDSALALVSTQNTIITIVTMVMVCLVITHLATHH
ncbi:U-scoloptoxin(05)-Sm1a-like [Oppia nitens]|uniref:U-scoloptoxin(05)-Sm1a-like n=1 Tax=Oppia nitens TaxID=1686743 RepID=UPI0023DA42C4|nr:U-scoloptoxin(05)-Sm1a-like [Oppia nitens]